MTPTGEFDMGNDPVIARIGRWKSYALYGSLAILLLPGLASVFLLEFSLVPKAMHVAFPQFYGARSEPGDDANHFGVARCQEP